MKIEHHSAAFQQPL